MANTIDNTDDIIDSRDVIARREELEGERDGLAEASTDAEGDVLAAQDDDTLEEAETARMAAYQALEAWKSEYGEELANLTALCEQAEGYADDWEHGAQLIRDSYFKEYAQQFADDIGAIDRNASWPCTCIDWDQAARELQMDYTSVEFDGVTYWVR